MTTYRCTACAAHGNTRLDGEPLAPCVLTYDEADCPPDRCPFGCMAPCDWHRVADEQEAR